MRIAGHRARPTHAAPTPAPARREVAAGDRLPEPGPRAELKDWIDYAISQGHDPEQAQSCSIEDLRVIWGSRKK